MESVLRRERYGAIERLVLNRPEQDNMLNDELSAALSEAFRDLAKDPSVHIIIVTGSGKSFCKSADGEEIREKYFGDPNAYRSYLIAVRDLHLLMQSVPKPIIAAVNGVASMGGLELALACDIIVASSTALLGDAHPAGIGGGGGSQRLRDAVGTRTTRWLLYTGEMFSAQRAFDAGLVQQVFDASTFDDEVLQLARHILSRKMGHSLSRIKALTAHGEPPLASLHVEIDHSVSHYFDAQVREALAAWVAAHEQPGAAPSL